MSVVDALLPDFLAQIERLKEIDVQLDPASAGRTTVLNAAIVAAGDHATKLEGEVNTLLASLTEAEMVGVATNLSRMLKREWSAKVDAYVAANVVEAEEVPAEELEKLNNERATLIIQAKAGRDFLLAYGVEEDRLPKVPSRRGRAKGTTTGPRLAGTYNFSVDGSPVDGHKLGDLQKALEASAVAEVREAIEASNPEFDYKAPPAEFTFKFGDKVVVAKASASDETDEEIDDNEPEDSEFDFDN